MKIYKRITWLGAGAVALAVLSGCNAEDTTTTTATPETEAPAAATPVAEITPIETGATGATAIANLKPTQGSQVSGTVTFTKVEDGIRVVAEFTGLKPGPHGFHVHENGDCSAPDASSAGGHFNPVDMPHGAPDDEKRHVGDLGNVDADSSGKARLERVDKVLTLEGPNSIVGKAVIVHEGADDMKTQPTGDAGGRDACGVVELQS